MRSMRRNMMVWCLVVVAAAFLSANLAHSQSINYGKLTGTITDDTGIPLPGVTLEVASAALIRGTRSTVSSEKGTYVFLQLPIGKYTLTASLEGFKKVIQENISIHAASSRVIDLVMETGLIEEEVTVIAISPVVDAKTSQIPANIESDLLDKLPTSRDAFYDLSLTTPGMVSQGKDGDWLPSPNAYGGTSNENIFLINGVNTTNPRAAAYGSLVKVNYNAVEEVRVIALGSKAEYGNFSGVAIDVLTKSGSNEFHGNVAFYSIIGKAASNQPGWTGKAADTPQAQDLGAFGPETFGERLILDEGDQVLKRATQDWEGNLTIGGPIIKDKVWFYAGFDYVRAETEVPFFPVNSNWWGRYGDLKISAEPWLNHRAWAAYHYENNDSTGTTWSPHWDKEMTYGTGTVGHSISAQWQWLATGKNILTAKYLGFWTDDKPFQPDDTPDHPGYINWWKWGTFGVNGNFPYVEAQKSSRQTIQADVSHYAEDFLGEHDIKFGVQYTRGRGNWMGGYFQGYANFAYPAPWTRYVSQLQSWYGATGLIWYNRQTWLPPFLTVRTSNQMGLFIDDQWTPTKRLTLNLGLRFDVMTTKYGIGKVYEQPATPDAINDPPPVVRSRSATDKIFDFKTLAPRVGITYALTSDMKTIFRASYGRYFLPLSVEFLRRFGPDMPAATYHWIYYNTPFNLIDTDGDDFISSDEVVEGARLLHDPSYLDPGSRPAWQSEYEDVDYSWQLNVAENVKDQRTDQFTVNLERELFSDFAASITYIYKRTANMFVQWPLNRETGQEWEYTRAPYTTQYGEELSLYDIVLEDYNNDGSIDGGDVGWIGTNNDFEVRNMGEIDGFKPRRTYQGVQFVLRKRYSNRWQMMASFLYSKSEGMAARSIRQDFNFEGPMVMDTTWISGLNQTLNTMEGPLPHTQKYEFKLSGSYKIPVAEVDLGVRFRVNSGRPLWPLEVIPVRTQWGNPPGSVVITGSAYVVSINSKEPWYLPWEYILDLRLDRAFRIADYGSLRLAVDILNVFNEDAVTNAGYGGAHEPVIGSVSGITFPSRKIRVSLSFQF